MFVAQRVVRSERLTGTVINLSFVRVRVFCIQEVVHGTASDSRPDAG